MVTIDVQLILNGIFGMFLDKIYKNVDDVREIEHGLFINKKTNPINPKTNILILRGGVNHCFSDTYYLKIFTNNFKDCNCFVLETIYPIINPNVCCYISKCIKYIKEINNLPIYVVGFSLGGTTIMYYLSMGLDEADGYITLCSPYDMFNVINNINDNMLYTYLYNKTKKAFQANNIDELFEKSNITREELNQVMLNFDGEFRKHLNNFKDKYIYIFGQNDVVTKNSRNIMPKQVNKIMVEGATHCCINSIYYLIKVVKIKINNIQYIE